MFLPDHNQRGGLLAEGADGSDSRQNAKGTALKSSALKVDQLEPILLIMGLGTALIGLLPSYDSIGVWAPVLLVVLRVLQGIGVGGEYGGAVLLADALHELAPAIAQVTFLDAPATTERPGIAEWEVDERGGVYGHPVPGIGYKIAFDAGKALDHRKLIYALRVVGNRTVTVHRDRHRTHTEESERHQPERKYRRSQHQAGRKHGADLLSGGLVVDRGLSS